jgi:regulatory protein
LSRLKLPEPVEHITKKDAKPLLTRPNHSYAFSIEPDYGTNGAVNARRSKQERQSRGPAPLNKAALDRLAIIYVGRYATTRKKLSDYLSRKVRERGWNDEEIPPIAAIVERMVALNYVNDEAFARMRAEGLTRRGYGPSRVALALRHAGINDEDAHDAKANSEAAAYESALAFAKRRRIGPFVRTPTSDQTQRNKALAAMCRAGHSYEIAQQILTKNAESGDES